MIETIDTSGKTVTESMEKIKNFEIHLKAKRSKTKMSFGLQYFDGRYFRNITCNHFLGFRIDRHL